VLKIILELYLEIVKVDKRIVIGLDRDGTINEDTGTYISKKEQFKPIPRSLEAIKEIKDLGYATIVLTNQAGVSKGHMDDFSVHTVHQHLEKLLFDETGCKLDGLLYSTGSDEFDNFRKPNIGMFLQAQRDYLISFYKGYYVGDKISDLEFASRFDVKPVLVRTGYGKITEKKLEESKYQQLKDKTIIFDDLYSFSQWIKDEAH